MVHMLLALIVLFSFGTSVASPVANGLQPIIHRGA